MAEHEHSEREAGRVPSKSPTGEIGGTPPSAEDNTRSEPSRDPNRREIRRGKRILKWTALIVGLLFFLSVLREAMDPFGDKSYVEISHGDHVHYVPENRDPNVPIGRFPRTEPAADERITPDGRIVKKE